MSPSLCLPEDRIYDLTHRNLVIKIVQTIETIEPIQTINRTVLAVSSAEPIVKGRRRLPYLDVDGGRL